MIAAESAPENGEYLTEGNGDSVIALNGMESEEITL